MTKDRPKNPGKELVIRGEKREWEVGQKGGNGGVGVGSDDLEGREPFSTDFDDTTV